MIRRLFNNFNFIAMIIFVCMFIMAIEPADAGAGDSDNSGQRASNLRNEDFDRLCEHKIPIIECDECRYEVGAVKITASQSGLINTEKLLKAPMHTVIEANGEMAFDEDTLRVISSRVAGRLASITVRPGDFVKEGQAVALIESHELAQAALEFLKSQAQVKLAEQKLARAVALRAKEIGSEQEVQEAQAALELAKIEQMYARRRLSLFGLGESEISSLLKKPESAVCRGVMTLYSPIEGRVVKREGIIGDMVNPDQKLLTIADLRHLWAVVEIHEQDIAPLAEAFRNGAVKAEITSEAALGTIFSAELLNLDAQICRDTRTLPIRLKVENHGEILRPGVFVKAKLYLGTGETKPTLPISAVVSDGGADFVFVRQSPDLFVRRDVKVGMRIGDRIVIESGLSEGDEIAVSGAFLLKSDILREKMGAGCAD